MVSERLTDRDCSDDAPANLVSRRSLDGRLTWEDAQLAIGTDTQVRSPWTHRPDLLVHEHEHDGGDGVMWGGFCKFCCVIMAQFTPI